MNRFIFSLLLILIVSCSTRPRCDKPAQRSKWRARTISVSDRVFYPYSLTEMINSFKSQDHISVLEIGTGEGVTLVELQKKFPVVHMSGINQKGDQLMCNDRDFLKSGEYYGILNSQDMENFIRIPKLILQDLNKKSLKAKDEEHDLIFSQYTIRYIRDKQKLLKEAWDALKVGGIILFEVSEWEASRKGERLSLKDYLTLLFPQANIVIGKNSFQYNEYESTVQYVYLQKTHPHEMKPACFLQKANTEVKGKYGGILSRYDCL